MNERKLRVSETVWRRHSWKIWRDHGANWQTFSAIPTNLWSGRFQYSCGAIWGNSIYLQIDATDVALCICWSILSPSKDDGRNLQTCWHLSHRERKNQAVEGKRQGENRRNQSLLRVSFLPSFHGIVPDRCWKNIKQNRPISFKAQKPLNYWRLRTFYRSELNSPDGQDGGKICKSTPKRYTH